jgi:hypothetical protein
LAVYWLLFAYFAAGAVLTREDPQRWRTSTPVLLLAGAAITWLVIGLRYKVGADWETYRFLFSYAGYADLWRALAVGDPGYQFVNWLVQHLGGGLWLVNLVCGLIFSWGLYSFARTQPDPWLCFAVAIPYLVTVVAMGYSRQAVAIGIILAGLAALTRGASIFRFALYVAGAALFHKTAVVVFPLVIFAADRNRFLNILAGIACAILLWDLFLAESVEGFVENYIKTEYSSQGAAIRLAMNLIPALALLTFRQRLRFDQREYRMWHYFSVAALLMPLLLLVLPSSTAIDRLALYLIPIQVAVLPRMQYLFKGQGFGRSLILLYAALVMFTWLNFAAHARYWVPYRLYPGIF